jgi:hypothetical protein
MTGLAALDPRGLGDTPAARRRALAALPDEALVERLVAMACALRETRAEQAAIARAASLPLAEVVASPFSLRAVAMGVEVGATTRHVELRLRPPWPDALVGGPEVRDPEHGVWDGGVLKTGKYQGFMADEPFATYDPAHVSKWGPHELMHRAAGFFFRPGLTRWELYLGARLNELVPVVLFYGPEQVMRLAEGAFDRRAAGARPAARLEEARWRTEDEAALSGRAARTVAQLRAGIAHFERELSAIDEELATGRRVRAPHPFLDASSDATAYVVGHHARLTDPAVSAVLARVPRAVRSEAPREYRDRIEALFDRLLFAPLEVDLERAARRRRARAVWDLMLRAAHLGEGVEVDLAPLLDDAAAAMAGEPPASPRAWRERLREVLGDEEAAVVLADGSIGAAHASAPAEAGPGAGAAGTQAAHDARRDAGAGAAGTQAAHDARRDAEAGTAGTEAARDAGRDAEAGTAGTEAARDAGRDAEAGATARDAGAGAAGTEAAHHAGRDAGAGAAGTEAAHDAGRDAGAGAAGTQAAHDAGRDAGAGAAGTEAAHHAGRDAGAGAAGTEAARDAGRAFGTGSGAEPEVGGEAFGGAGAGAGWGSADEAALALAPLGDGVGQVVPCAWALLDDEGALGRFAASAALWDRAPLAERVARWLEADGAPEAVREMARFEGAIVRAERDDGVERLGVPAEALPADLAEGVVVRSETFARLDLGHDVLSVHAAFAAGEPPEPPAPAATTLLVGAYFDGVSVLPLPPAVAAAWDALADAARPARELIAAIDATLGTLPEGWPADGDAWLRELVTAGAVAWRPR